MRLVALVALLALLAGCASDETASWRIRFASNADRAEAAWVRARVARGACDGEALYEDTAAAGTAPGGQIPALESGEWFFSAVALDASCRVIASACDAIRLPLGRAELLTTLASVATPTGGCPATLCVDGECVSGDAGPDGGPLDAGRPDGGGLPAPRVLWPWNGVTTGSARAAPPRDPDEHHPLRPRFRFEPVTEAGSHVLELVECETFPAGCDFASAMRFVDNTGGDVLGPPQPLAVPTTTPVGARYAFRLGACEDGNAVVGCAFTDARYLDVGRVREDLDGDGLAEIVVTGQRASGRTVVVFQRGAMGGRRELAISGLALRPLAFVGDVDGDRRGELLLRDDIASWRVVSDDESVYGSASASASSQLALEVAGVGDLDGDGFADFAVGAPGTDDGSGQVQVYFGGATFEPNRRFEVLSPSGPGTELGFAIAGAGDWDGDGHADIAVLERGTSRNRINAYVLTGIDDGPPVFTPLAMDLASDSAEPGTVDVFLAGGRDMDGDGRPEVAVSFSRLNEIRIYSPRADGSVREIVVTPPVGYEDTRFGNTLALFDFDGEGRSALLTGAPDFQACPLASTCPPDPTSRFGAVVRIDWFGGAVATVPLDGLVEDQGFGRAVVGVDYDGNGTEDIVGTHDVSLMPADRVRGLVYDFLATSPVASAELSAVLAAPMSWDPSMTLSFVSLAR